MRHQSVRTGHRGTLALSDGHVNLTVAGRQPPQLPLTQLVKIVQGLTIATDPFDVATWFNAADALNH